jgi:hypothetical protein
MAVSNHFGERGLLAVEVGQGECARRGDLRIDVTSSSNACQLARLIGLLRIASEREMEGANVGRGSPGGRTVGDGIWG